MLEKAPHSNRFQVSWVLPTYKNGHAGLSEQHHSPRPCNELIEILYHSQGERLYPSAGKAHPEFRAKNARFGSWIEAVELTGGDPPLFVPGVLRQHDVLSLSPLCLTTPFPTGRKFRGRESDFFLPVGNSARYLLTTYLVLALALRVWWNDLDQRGEVPERPDALHDVYENTRSYLIAGDL